MSKIPQKVKVLENKKISIFQNLKIHLFYLVNVDRRWSTSTPRTFLGRRRPDCTFPAQRRPFYSPFHHALNCSKMAKKV